jgi:orotate phosphoribosyltransferase
MKKSTNIDPRTADRIAAILLSVEAVDVQPKNNPFTWSSGLKSPIYCDNRKLLSYPDVRSFVVTSMSIVARHVEKSPTIAGVATGAIAWGALIADKIERPFIYVRSKAKGHGKENQIEGVLHEGDNVILIEDLVSTGGSVLRAVQAIRDAGGICNHVIALFTYGFPDAQKAFAEAGVTLHTLCDFEALLPVAVEKKKITESERAEVQAFGQDPEGWLPKRRQPDF